MVVAVLLLLVGAVLGVALTLLVSRPNLRAYGGGGGGGPEWGYSNYITIINDEFLGIRSQRTLFRRRERKRPIQFGLGVSRKAARECRGYIRVKGGEWIGVYWAPENDPASLSNLAVIGSGERMNLMLLARLPTEPSKYFPNTGIDAAGNLMVPADSGQFEGPHEFDGRILFESTNPEMTFEFAVREHPDGNLYSNGAGGPLFP